MKKLIGLLFIQLAITITTFGQSRDTINLEEVEVIDHRVKKEASMTRSVMDTIALMHTKELSLSELLTQSSPVFVKTYGRGAMATVSFRGTGASHTNITWNGIQLNSPNMGMVDVSLIPVFFIDKMELKHGASSLISGSGGLGGSIDIENQPDWGKHAYLEFTQGVGSFSTFDEFLTYKFGNKSFRSASRVFYSSSENDFKYEDNSFAEPSLNGVKVQKNGAYLKYGGLQEFYWLYKENNVFSIKVWSQYNKKNIPGILGSLNVELQNYQIDKNTYITADWKHYGDAGQVLKVQTAYLYNNTDYYYAVPYMNYDTHSDANSILAKANYEHPLSEAAMLFADLSYRRDFVSNNQNQSFSSDPHFFRASQDRISSKIQGVFLLGKRFTINALSRFEWVNHNLKAAQIVGRDFMDMAKNNGGDFEFIPSLGLEYLLEKSHSWKLTANAARNYHFPSLNDLYYLPGGNPDLKPERGISFEIGTSANIFSKDEISVEGSLTTFRSFIDNWIVWVIRNEYATAKNLKEVDIQGLETNWKIYGGEKFKYKAIMNYALTFSTNKTDSGHKGDESMGKQLPYIPKHSANVLLGLNYKGFSFNYNFGWYSRRFTTTSNQESTRNILPPVYQHDISLGKDFKLWKFPSSLELKINNLLNQTQVTLLRRPMPGINYTMQFKIKLENNKK
ncbi:MAG: TonB-dependent receptor [Bacteroidales bacterium]